MFVMTKNPCIACRRSAETVRRRYAFTLIEILVVVAIIILLVAILLPSLSRARERSRAAVCLSQLKEMGRAVQMYGVDYRDSLPGPLHMGVLLET